MATPAPGAPSDVFSVAFSAVVDLVPTVSFQARSETPWKVLGFPVSPRRVSSAVALFALGATHFFAVTVRRAVCVIGYLAAFLASAH